MVHEKSLDAMRHFAYAAGWKKFEPLWDFVIRARRVGIMRPVLETILGESVRKESAPGGSHATNGAAAVPVSRRWVVDERCNAAAGCAETAGGA
jgi:hypothetical protein